MINPHALSWPTILTPGFVSREITERQSLVDYVQEVELPPRMEEIASYRAWMEEQEETPAGRAELAERRRLAAEELAYGGEDHGDMFPQENGPPAPQAPAWQAPGAPWLEENAEMQVKFAGFFLEEKMLGI